MQQELYFLQPFERTSETAALEIRVAVVMKARGMAHFLFTLKGPLDRLVIPGLSPVPARKDKLWEHLCLEVFIGSQENPCYWEMNCSPSRDWNVYSFADYRKGQRPEMQVVENPIQKIEISGQSVHLDAILNIAALWDLPDLQKGSGLSGQVDLGLSAVVEHQGGLKTYWALAHPCKKPDFHERKGWKHATWD